jgi:hypothetical protein
MPLTVLLVLATFSLPLGSLPSSDQAQAFRILAITLVPAARVKDTAASLAKADARSQPLLTAGRAPLRTGMLILSHGR